MSPTTKDPTAPKTKTKKGKGIGVGRKHCAGNGLVLNSD